ncbi:hypothetical protein VC83_04184 [Pseudogymnoascus destructans]|uniref:Ubiquitin-like protease family profile domain-containing protein n=1 Tax=Pseudogymnoascus destructans TaxID=655981 RepID=A0A177ADG9_9PEZI|nr:uncharacterized protein VC83_04190 [Pseudogymnoascus destructans]XP_024324517.1 uncharacterized protein VC83_04184 [Pseudogymnoascus destructans]OAF59033.1 hypothetical protein VC83_04190 [Pseudogymnoascus destructans]OAF59233.1 hypothetical protein VC83_04184 [Pseudogymnoascus destructans]
MVLEVDLGSVADYVAHVELRPLIDAFRQRKRIVIIAGAGISASAGIATFQDLPVKGRDVFSMNSYNDDASTTLLNETMCRMYSSIRSANPTQFHHVIEELAKEDRLHRLYTQNIDGLDTQLPSLGTKIPLPETKPWPTTIQLHGDLRTVKCQGNPTHLGSFNPDYDYADTTAIAMVSASDLRSKPDAVIVVGTALKVESRRKFTIDMCAAVRKCGGLSAWINLEPPSQPLKCFNIVVKGDSDTIAMHVSSWWLKDCPNIISNANIKYLQDKYKLFIARSTEEARGLLEQDQKRDPTALGTTQNILLDSGEAAKLITFKAINHNAKKATPALPHKTIRTQAPSSIVPPKTSSASSIIPPLWQSTSSIVPHLLLSASQSQAAQASASNVSHKPVSAPIASLAQASASNVSLISASQASQLPTSVLSSVLHPFMTTPAHSGLEIVPKITPGWELETSKRLDSVIVRGIKVKNHRSLSVLTTITNLGYEANIALSLWRLKHGEYLDDEVINAYIELLQRSNLPHGQGKYSIFIPFNDAFHWTFAVIKSQEKGTIVQWEYFDSLGGKPPQVFLDWIGNWFPKKQRVPALPNPKQNNEVDCGLFVLLGIRLMASGKPHLSNQQAIAHTRI